MVVPLGSVIVVPPYADSVLPSVLIQLTAVVLFCSSDHVLNRLSLFIDDASDLKVVKVVLSTNEVLKSWPFEKSGINSKNKYCNFILFMLFKFKIIIN